MSIKYTIAVIHYNMAKTVERSLRSILDQIDDRFEVLVVDGGSTDGSLEILKRMERKEKKLRVIVEEKRGSLGKARNIGIKEAKGDYVLLQHDMDDFVSQGFFTNLVEIYHQIERQLDFNFYFGSMIKKKFLLELGGYRDLDVGEDRDLWRRILAKDNMILLKYPKAFRRQIGYRPNFLEKLKLGFLLRKGELKSGVSFPSYIKWIFLKDSKLKIPYNLMFTAFAYVSLWLEVHFGNGKRYRAPTGFERKGTLIKILREKLKTLPEIEEEYGIKIDRDKLSEKWQEIFFPD